MDKSSNPMDQISSLARQRLRMFCLHIRDDGTYVTGIYKGVRSTSQQISDDYGRRFLIELIQNAYDAHPPDRSDGRIKLLLIRDDDENGALYVANGGRGFLKDDVQSLCDIGTSSKPVGESIGNKGLGFRSVRYVTDDPQIYSKATRSLSGSFDGYCFRFARGDDFDELLEDAHHRALAKKDMPFFHIPVPLTDQNAVVRQLAAEGFSTAVRLPMRNRSKLQLVIELFSRMRAQEVPLLLFLQRISALEVVIDGEPERSFSLQRKDTPVLLEARDRTGDTHSCVDLGGGEKYFIAWHMVPEASVKAAILESTDQGQLHPDWEDWKGDGEVAVAVRLDGDVVSPRLYAYLPMGAQARSPFPGYLHGAFYPKADRTTLDASIPINGLYVEEAAKLCVRTILTLREMRDGAGDALSVEELATAIVDLLTWNSFEGIPREGVAKAPLFMRKAFEEAGVTFAKAGILPIIHRRRRGGWGTPEEVWRWDQPNLTVFGADSLVRMLRTAIMSPKLGKERLDRLQEFMTSGDDDLTLTPSDADLSDMAERVAAKVITGRSSKRAKTNYYMELETVLRNTSASVSGRRVLYCSDGILRASESAQDRVEVAQDPTFQKRRSRRTRADSDTIVVFSPSRRSIDEAKGSKHDLPILQVPKPLQKNLAFLSDELDWYGELEGIRKLLEGSRLVRSYDATELVSHVSSLATSNANTRIRQAALSWVFKLWSSYQNAPRTLALQNVSLFVPTLKGQWIEADKAIFSSGWPARTLGNITEEFLSQVGSYSDDLMRMGDRLLAQKTARPFMASATENWATFLEAIGVRGGLDPVRIEIKDLNMLGSNLDATNVCARFRMDKVIEQQWQEDIAAYGGKTKYRNSLHELEGSLWYMPGQEKHSSFPEGTKLHYAQLILQWLNAAEDKYFRVSFRSPSAIHASRFDWPTPLAAFMRQAAWFPVEIQEDMKTRLVFLKPSEVWMPEEEESQNWPPYLPSVHKQTRRRISDSDIFNELVQRCGVNVLNDPVSLPKQAWYLGRLYKEGRIDSYHLTPFINLYNRTWAKLAESDGIGEVPVSTTGRYLITQRNNEYSWVDVSGSDDLDADTASQHQCQRESEIYVRDSEDTLGRDLVAKQGAHLFDPGPQDAASIASVLRDLLGERFRAVSGIQITIVVEAEEYIPGKTEEAFAVDVCPWLPHVVSISMECLKGPAAQRLPADRSVVISRLHKTRIRHASNVQYKVRDTYTPLTNSRYGAVALRDTGNPILIIQSDAEDLDWDALANASSQLSQLLGQADLARPIKQCFRKLQCLEELAAGPIGDVNRGIDELCSELEVERTRADIALEGLSHSIIRLARLLRPVVHHCKGIDASEQFGCQASHCKTLQDLAGVLSTHMQGTRLLPDQLMATCQRATGFDTIQEDLGLPFGSFNRSLVAVGEDPITYPDLHDAVVRSYIGEHKDTIMDCLRHPFVDQFDSGQSLEEYIRCREDLDKLGPEREWLADFRVPETSMIEELVNDWLAQIGAPMMNVAPESLPRWPKVRTDNNLQIRRLVHSQGNTVKAWCYRQGIPPPRIWNDTAASDCICNELHELGALDFKLLSESDLISWLARCGIWPTGMPQTTALEQLGLTAKDIDEESNRARAARRQHEKEARSIVFNGRNIDPEDAQEADAQKLADEIKNNLSRSIKSVRLGSIAYLSGMPRSKTKPGHPGRGAGGGRGRKSPPIKTELIGFLGECTVYYWLKSLQLQCDVDAAWVSGYRSKLLPGAGDDSLGYDFRITYRNQTWFLEVKASLGDPQEFELGETEIRMARDCATKRGREYRIVYVSNVGEQGNRGIEVLPNPLSEEGRNLFRIGDKGILYEFIRKP